MFKSVIELAGIAAQREQPGPALSAIAELRGRLEELEEFQVENAREQGWSWSEIARPLRVTRQAVHRKYANRLAGTGGGAREDRMVVSAEARRCVVRARREAATLGHDSVGTDHLLLGLAAEKSTAAVLLALGVSLGRARTGVLKLRGTGGKRASESRAPLPVSPRAREALEQSLREALRLGDAEIGARHVLLALLRDDASRARRALDGLGVAPAAIEERLGR
jgi:ClpA/ClpB-like protein